MPETRRRVACLLHGTQCHCADDALLRRSFYTIKHLLDITRAHFAVLIDVQTQPKCREQALKPLNLLGNGRLMHAVDERFLLQLHMARNCLIRSEHALLDD